MAVTRTDEQKRRHREYMRGYYTVQNPEKREMRLRKMRQWYVDNRPARAVYEQVRKHGLSMEQFEALIDKQNWRCALCGRIPDPGMKSFSGFHIDHDHKCCPGAHSCGKCVRGALCSQCNMGLGNFGDDWKRLMQALEYVEKWQ